MELVQWQSTSLRPLAVATIESGKLENVKGLDAFACLGVKGSVDLNRRKILLLFCRYLLYTIIKIYFQIMTHKNQFTPISPN